MADRYYTDEEQVVKVQLITFETMLVKFLENPLIYLVVQFFVSGQK